ncbi:MAG: beta-ketoacyl-ACP synthase III [Pseudomonadota bacterium]
MPHSTVISGTGLYTPPFSISNQELVNSYNAYADAFNEANAEAISAGSIEALQHSSTAFIEKASGIQSRYVYVKDGILDIERMCPRIAERREDELSHQAEIAVAAARDAMAAAGKRAADIDMVIVSCAYTQRAYPAIAIEVQQALGIDGSGFDMLVACSAATFGLHRAVDAVAAGSARCVLAINPELVTPQVNFRDRDSHFIFGDVGTAAIVERAETATAPHRYAVLGTKAMTLFSSNIRSNFGHLSRAHDVDPFGPDKLFHQNGRKVYKEVCPMAVDHISEHLKSLNLAVEDVTRWWLHQANINMNAMVIRKLLGREPAGGEAPMVLDRFANTASAGSIIAFNRHHEDLGAGAVGVICSFGAGYSIGSLVVRKM